MVDGGDQARAFADRERTKAGLNLSFGAALALLKGGARIRRADWVEGEGWILLVEDPALGEPWIGFSLDGSDFISWTPDHEDLLANDWMVVDVSAVDPANVLRVEGAGAIAVTSSADLPHVPV